MTNQRYIHPVVICGSSRRKLEHYKKSKKRPKVIVIAEFKPHNESNMDKQVSLTSLITPRINVQLC